MLPTELTRVRLADWFLTPAERGNPATRLDARRGDGLAWSSGNRARPLVHGASYFAAPGFACAAPSRESPPNTRVVAAYGRDQGNRA